MKNEVYFIREKEVIKVEKNIFIGLFNMKNIFIFMGTDGWSEIILQQIVFVHISCII